MDFRKIKKITFALTLALGFAGAPGLSSLFTVQAQEPRPQEMRREQLERVSGGANRISRGVPQRMARLSSRPEIRLQQITPLSHGRS
jgi:hypothetical protein